MKPKLIPLIALILVCQLAGLLGSFFTAPSIPAWYAGLEKPSFSPPNWLFAPVWLILYTLMGVAAYLIWERGIGRKEARSALIIFALQLVLNTFWSLLFFGLQSPKLALIEIVILWFFIFLTIWKFAKISSLAGLLLLPYLAWVSFAALLNFFIFRLN
jgi:benzodiazapine receptor